MTWIPPKIDWNSEDYFNIEDLNKIENNTLQVYVLAKLLRGEFDLYIVLDHDMKTIPFDDLLNRIELNITELGEILYKPIGWTELNMDWLCDKPFDFEAMNKWEYNLLLLYKFAKGNIDLTPYCGQMYAREEVI